jgi:2-hydroxymuconate-semialdehyde hydrolase
MQEQKNPEIGKNIVVNGIATNYHDVGQGAPLLMIHGSGPGVTAWANWRLALPELSKNRRVIAPDVVGFGFTERPAGIQYNIETWVGQLVGLLDALDLQRVDIVGNSFGGALALKLAIQHPDRVGRIVLMGSGGVSYPMTAELDSVWGYQPSIENMRKMLDIFAYDRSLVTGELAAMRYKASIQPGFQEAYSSMFPAPRQRWLDAMANTEEQIRAIPHETLVVHGREDRVIPLSSSLTLANWLPNSQLHVYGHCGHWTQIEHASRFSRLVNDFLSEER